MTIRVVEGDITRQDVEAIVTAANSALRGGGGVDGAVHRAAGPQLLEACRPLAPCPPGSAVITPAFDLHPVRWVIHAVGPVYSGTGDAPVLAATYRAALDRAHEVDASSVALPAISTGVFGYPLAEAAAVSAEAVLSRRDAVSDIVLVAFDEQTARAWSAALAARGE